MNRLFKIGGSLAALLISMSVVLSSGCGRTAKFKELVEYQDRVKAWSGEIEIRVIALEHRISELDGRLRVVELKLTAPPRGPDL